MKQRCDWANKNELDKEYHDNEWGIPVHDDQQLFEQLILESMQAGLSWSTILSKRDSIKEAFDYFDIDSIENYSDTKIDNLMENPGIIRNKQKIKATISNASAFKKIQREFSSFDSYIWAFVDEKTIINHWNTLEDVPSSTELSKEISQDLKKRGFKFLGPTSVYAFMQSIGMVDDHMEDCFKRTGE